DALECNAAALIEDAVGNSDVLEAAVGLGSALDAAGSAFGGLGRTRPPGPIEHRAHLVVARHVAIGDRDVFGRACVSERIRALRTDPIVPGRVHRAVADAHVAT